MKTLEDYLDEYEIEVDKYTDELDVVRSLMDIIYDEHPNLYNIYKEDDLECEIEVEMDSEYHDAYNSSYYYHFRLTQTLEDRFADIYPEKVI